MFNFMDYKRFWLMLFLAVVLPLSMSFAQEGGGAAEVDPNDVEETETEGGEGAEGEQVEPAYEWQAEREMLREQIASEVKSRVDQTITHPKTTNGIRSRAASFEAEILPIMTTQRSRFYEKEKRKWQEDIDDEDDTPLEYPDMSSFLAYKTNGIEWKYPIKAANPSDPGKVRDALEKELYETFDAACPAEDTAVLREKGQKKYPMAPPAKERPNVKFKLRGGKGTNTEVEGQLRFVQSLRIKVNERWINRIDMEDEAAALFYPDVNKKLVDDYVNQEIRKYSALREGFVFDWVQLLLPDRLMSAGYVPDKYLTMNPKTKRFDYLWRQSSNVKSWITAKAFEDRAYKIQYEAETKRQMAIVSKEIFTNASQYGARMDYVWLEEAKDYVPVEKVEEEKARIEEEEKQKKDGQQSDMM